MTYRPNTSETIWDVALANYGSVDAVATLLRDNPAVVSELGDIDIRSELLVSQRGGVVPGSRAASAQRIAVPRRQNAPERVGLAAQNLWDIALQHYGDVNAVLWLLQDNPTLVDQTGVVESGRILYKLRPAEQMNRWVWERFIDYYPVSGAPTTVGSPWITEDGQPWITEDGQEWWIE